MGSQVQHARSAKTALALAEKLRASDPEWALVPLFYSAMHLVHGALDRDGLTATYGHPRKHHSIRDQSTGDVREWGTLDVLALEYRAIASAYRDLHKVSQQIRYQHVESLRSTDRFWADYAEIAKQLGAVD